MTDRPIDLDGHRTARAKIESDLRRKAVNTGKSPDRARGRADCETAAMRSLMPARTFSEALERVVFLLRRYAETAEANDPRLQKLIRRAEEDLARLGKLEDKQP